MTIIAFAVGVIVGVVYHKYLLPPMKLLWEKIRREMAD